MIWHWADCRAMDFKENLQLTCASVGSMCFLRDVEAEFRPRVNNRCAGSAMLGLQGTGCRLTSESPSTVTIFRPQLHSKSRGLGGGT